MMIPSITIAATSFRFAQDIAAMAAVASDEVAPAVEIVPASAAGATWGSSQRSTGSRPAPSG